VDAPNHYSPVSMIDRVLVIIIVLGVLTCQLITTKMFLKEPASCPKGSGEAAPLRFR
jgi:hypothetical protein